MARDASLALVETHDKMEASSLATSSCASRATTRMDTTGQLSGGHWQSAACPLRRVTRRGSPSTWPQIILPTRNRLQSAVCKRASQCPRVVNAKTAQSTTTPRRPTGALMHAGPLSSVELAVKDPPPSTSQRGWCRIMGSCRSACSSLVPSSCATLAISDAFTMRRAHSEEA